MNNVISKALLTFVFLALSPFAAAAADATSDNTAAVENGIRERIARLEKLWAKGDGAGIAREVYGRDAVIQGEGQKETIKTSAAVEDVIKHLVADSRTVKLDLYGLRALSSDAALTWVTWHVTPRAAGAKPFDVKALFVWIRGVEGWRIRADMYTMGAM